MSDELVLPKDATIVVNLLRPLRGASPAVEHFVCMVPTRCRVAAAAVGTKRAPLMALLPELLHPGVPVCLTVTVILPDGRAEAVASIAELPRAVRRDELGDAIFAQVPALLRRAFEIVTAAAH